MKMLIVEDDQFSRSLLQKMLSPHGECHVAVNGKEGLVAVASALEEGAHYRLICLDIMMPEVDGLQCLREIRALERKFAVTGEERAKIVMTTAVDNMKSVMEAYSRGGCDAYLVKPFEQKALFVTLRTCGLAL